MMRGALSKSCVVVALVAALVLGLAAAGLASEFSADLVRTVGGKTSAGKLYFKGDKIREDVIEKGANSVSIIRLDKRVSWTLLEDNEYMEIALPFDPAKSEEVPAGFEYDKAVLGSEVVSGYECEIVQYTYKKKTLGILTQWVAKGLNFALKTETKSSKGKVTSTTELKNIKVESIPDHFFEIPPGYEKMSLPFGLKLPGFGG